MRNKAPETIVIDYGGANVAKLYMLDICVQQLLVKVLNVLKDLWVIKLFLTFIWETGDFRWDLLLQNLKCRKPDLVYFDESYTGEYPEEAPLQFLN